MSEPAALLDDRPVVTSADVYRLTDSQRRARVGRLVEESFAIVDAALAEHVPADQRRVAGIVTLFSGGSDSTVLAHLMRPITTHAAHANTTIGIEETRDFVRSVCEGWGIPLLERTPPRVEDHYRTLVLDQGFPGPGHHYKMFQRLKERALEQVRRELVTQPYRERVVFLAGRRREESKRRQAIPEHERNRSTVWVSPLAHWTKADLTTYRLMHADGNDPVPVNRVSDLIHMSGECLCGSFASPGERGELDYWFGSDAALQLIAELETLIADRDDIPPHRRTWGWGADPDVVARTRTSASKTGPLCSSCDDRFQDAIPGLDVTA